MNEQFNNGATVDKTVNQTATQIVDKNSAPLLSIKNLQVEGYSDAAGWTPCIKNIGLTLHRGEVLGLIGESGAGKSTLGIAAMGYARDGCKIRGGSICFDGEELLQMSEKERRRLRGVKIAYVAQSAAASFNSAHRLINQCTEVSLLHNLKSRAESESEVMMLYQVLQLPSPGEIGFRYPHQVSGGQLQRVMTAMAMCCRPDLIIFDEPTTALDVTTQIEVLGAIRNAVRKFNTAALYISHDLAVVAQMTDRIMVLKDGELVEENNTREMLKNPREDYTKSLWAVRRFSKPLKPPPSKKDAPVLQMKNVFASYGDSPVLYDVSIALHRGRTVALVGESGSGKSTAARCLTGLLPPVAGELLQADEVLSPSLRGRTRRQLQQIQMIYQMPDTAVNPRHKVRDIIGRPLSFYLSLNGKERNARVAELLEQIELDAGTFMDRYPGELSGGQKQRVCIARALAAKPQIIICDEVTSALDQIVAEGVLRLLQRLQDNLGLSYLFITHDIATVRAVADDVVVMNGGRVIESGVKEEVFSPPHDDYTHLLLSSVPQMDPDWLSNLLTTRREKESAATEK